MTEDEAFDRLRHLLVTVDAEGAALGWSDGPLTDIVHAHQRTARLTGAFGIITPLGSRDSGEGAAICYEAVDIDGEERVVETRTSGVIYGWRIDVYASRAADIARAFHAAMRSARAQLDLAPLVISEVGEVKGTAEREQEHFNGRANFSAFLTTARSQRTLIDVMERGHIDLIGDTGKTPPIRAPIDYAKD